MTKGTINAAISRDMVRRARMTTRRATQSRPGREAVTHWQVTKQIEGAYGKFALLEVRSKRDERTRSGYISRRLAIRWRATRYMARHPRLAKPQSYGGTAPEVASLKRNFLHAFAIQFRHPISERPLSFQQPLPAELSDFLRRIGD